MILKLGSWQGSEAYDSIFLALFQPITDFLHPECSTVVFAMHILIMDRKSFVSPLLQLDFIKFGCAGCYH